MFIYFPIDSNILDSQCSVQLDFSSLMSDPPLRLVSNSLCVTFHITPLPSLPLASFLKASSFNTDPVLLRPVRIYLDNKDNLSSPLSCLALCKSILSYVVHAFRSLKMVATWTVSAPLLPDEGSSCTIPYKLDSSFFTLSKYMNLNKTQY